MPPRRSHTKSRRGCQQCKDRHTKCDEQQPTCGLCMKRGLSCTRPPAQIEAQLQTPLLTARPRPVGRTFPSPSPATFQSGSRGSGKERNRPTTLSNPVHRTRLYEIRLFHHFVTHTSPTFTRNSRDKYLWQTVVPHLATSHDYVMDSVLAIAALHIASATTNTAESQSYIDSALDYHTAALTTSRERLSASDSPDQDACAICSICILITVTAYSNMSPEKNQRDPLHDILEKRTILRGTRFLIHQADEVSTDPFLKKWRIGDVEELDQSEPPEKYRLTPRALHGEILEKLIEVKSRLYQCRHSSKEVLITAYGLVEKAIRDWPVHAGEMGWALEVSDDYIDLLKSGDWLARVILMFYGLCLHLSSEIWAIQDAGRRLLSIIPRRNHIPSEWVGCITWIGQALER